MSNSWQGGSSSAWRKVRLEVLERDRWQCQLCHEPIPQGLPRAHPRAAQVHHVGSRAVTGDDPAGLVASHRECNLKAGDPTAGDPAPSVGGWW
jgi:5-methylcytosine-specific restriction endonuclease McrA